ncbi:hypothetical protein UFOVP245_125 [uncultured Caudovirales phage]|uniref:Uncharacterized protein n=1 Tax=uncultured Caudovirales phage TaxID=2100421 RepID=A0A6J7WTA2_9CAUD|nr:hypothetical protein UFOVP245_125 [uncultured Caudovirales phage]
MNIVSPLAVSYSKNLSFSFSNTLRNEAVNLNNFASANYIIDVNGTIYQGAQANDDQATIIIIGGDDRFIGEKAERLSSSFFYTEPQKIVLYKILKEAAHYSASASITSDNDKLDIALNALYKNLSR